MAIIPRMLPSLYEACGDLILSFPSLSRRVHLRLHPVEVIHHGTSCTINAWQRIDEDELWIPGGTFIVLTTSSCTFPLLLRLVFASLSCPSPSPPSLIPFILSLSPPILGAVFFFQLHLAFSALLCPTQGESTSFQTQPYFSSPRWSLESRPHTRHTVHSSLRVGGCVLVYLHVMCTFYNVSRLTWHAMSSWKHSIPLLLSSCLSAAEWPQLQVNN